MFCELLQFGYPQTLNIVINSLLILLPNTDTDLHPFSSRLHTIIFFTLFCFHAVPTPNVDSRLVLIMLRPISGKYHKCWCFSSTPILFHIRCATIQFCLAPGPNKLIKLKPHDIESYTEMMFLNSVQITTLIENHTGRSLMKYDITFFLLSSHSSSSIESNRHHIVNLRRF